MAFSDELSDVLGYNRRTAQLSGVTPYQQIIGAAIGIGGTVGGLIGAFGSKPPNYNISMPSNEYSNLLSSQQAGFNSATAAYNTSMTNLGTQMAGQAVSGLSARGIANQGTIAATKASVGSSISSARAAAAQALQEAQLKAGNQLESSLAGYNMQLSNNAYKAAMQKYAAQQGLWGALGGVGAGLSMLDKQQLPVRGSLQPGQLGDEDVTNPETYGRGTGPIGPEMASDQTTSLLKTGGQ
jgi:hypothetical protein